MQKGKTRKKCGVRFCGRKKFHIVDLWVRRTMYPSTYGCENDHWRKISPSKNFSVLKKIAVFRENLFCDTLYFSDFFVHFQVLELLSANVPLKKSQPITRKWGLRAFKTLKFGHFFKVWKRPITRFASDGLSFLLRPNFLRTCDRSSSP